MPTPFTRDALGEASDIRLLPVSDRTESAPAERSDETFAAMGTFNRGKLGLNIVNRTDFLQKLGQPGTLRASALNEAAQQIHTALSPGIGVGGAFQAVVYRLHTASSVNRYIVATANAGTGEITWSLSATLPTGDYTLAFQHLDCYNDGLRIRLHADRVNNASGTAIDSQSVKLQFVDSANSVLFTITGSLNPDAVDEFGNTFYLLDRVSQLGYDDRLKVFQGSQTSIRVNTAAYGKDTNGLDKYSDSGLQLYFTEGARTYAQADYDKAFAALEASEVSYDYLISGGSQAIPVIVGLSDLAYRVSSLLRWDVPGSLTPTEAVAFIGQLGINPDYAQAQYSVCSVREPLTGARSALGMSGVKVGMACFRNGLKNNDGVAEQRKHPIAGYDYPIALAGLRQERQLTRTDLEILAQAKINPVFPVTYGTANRRFVFWDSLTQANTTTSIRKLEAAMDMLTWTEKTVCRFMLRTLQNPKKVQREQAETFLQDILERLASAGWLVPADALNGDSFAFAITDDPDRPDRVRVRLSLCFDGTVRQIEVGTSLVK